MIRENEKLSERVASNFTEREVLDMSEEAEAAGMTLAQWLRKIARKELYGVSRRQRRDGNENASGFGELR